jgi:hypothetical protein
MRVQGAKVEAERTTEVAPRRQVTEALLREAGFPKHLDPTTSPALAD